MILKVLFFCVSMYYICKWLEKATRLKPLKDGSDQAFLSMCCRRSGKHIGKIFVIAAQRAGFQVEDESDAFIRKDVRRFLRNDNNIPMYVREFISEGRKEMEWDGDTTDG